MRRSLVGIWAVVSLGLLASCSLLGPDGPEVTIGLLGPAVPPPGVEPVEWFEAPPRVEAVGGSGELVVTGDFLLPSSGIHMQAGVALTGNDLVLEVDYREEGGTLDQWMATYEALIARVSPGQYSLVVKHRIDWSRHSLPLGMTEVLRTEVTVR